MFPKPTAKSQQGTTQITAFLGPMLLAVYDWGVDVELSIRYLIVTFSQYFQRVEVVLAAPVGCRRSGTCRDGDTWKKRFSALTFQPPSNRASIQLFTELLLSLHWRSLGIALAFRRTVFDIFTTGADGCPQLMVSVGCLTKAQEMARQLSFLAPGEYFGYFERTGDTVEPVSRLVGQVTAEFWGMEAS